MEHGTNAAVRHPHDGAAMRAVDCPCGEHLQAEGDNALFDLAKQHASERHAEDPAFSEFDLLAMIERVGYDMPAQSAGEVSEKQQD